MSSVETLLAADDAYLAGSQDEVRLPLRGLESVVAGALAALPPGAWWVPGPREAIGAVRRGVNEARLEHPHRGARPYKVAPTSHAPALRALQAVGLARGSDGPVLVHLGTGSVSDGAFAEALNLAALLEVPVVFLVSAWALDGDAPVGPQSAAGAEALATAHGLATHTADGRDAASVQAAVERALAGGAPAVVIANL